MIKDKLERRWYGSLSPETREVLRDNKIFNSCNNRA